MRHVVIALAMLATACGGGAATPTAPSASTPAPAPAPTPAPSPSPAPAPAPVPATTSGFAGVVTDTISGAPVSGFAAVVSGSRVTVSAPGYVTREIRAGISSVDLIPQAGFNLDFYRQFARGSLGGSLQPLAILNQAPSFYMEVEGAKGFSAQVGAQLEQVARRIVPELTGGRFQVTRWETGPTPRPRQNGWIVIERQDLGNGICGTAFVGATAGQINLDADRLCRVDAVLAHEIGHALGFSHVNLPGSLMYPQYRDSNVNDAPTELERRHAAIAYKRSPGNRDVDVDP